MRELCTTVSNVGNDKSKKYASHAIAPSYRLAASLVKKVGWT